MSVNKFSIRHGDILVVAVEGVPECAVRVSIGPRGAVLAEGEVTGHAHVLDAAVVEMWQLGNRLFARLPEGGRLAHEEHGVVDIPPGIYESLRQRVYTPAEVRHVLD